ncbi:DUF6968 family protein [Nocardia sp. KC 131]|uniref:DUF6968 family protein n=1 Tax=Nocardia arseniciresistens TaxID=3392119 RepID=UPI00398F25DD
MRSEIGDVIATRTVTDGDHSVLIEVGRPRPAASSGGAACWFWIQGRGLAVAGGVDTLAALYSALVEIGAVLDRTNKDGSEFTTVGPADLGFPGQPRHRNATIAGADYELGELLAIRTLTIRESPHTITIGRPVQADDDQFYLCPFRIDGRHHSAASGLDGVQALLTALRMIGAWLDLPHDWPVSRIT